jgi:hypothetical protein
MVTPKRVDASVSGGLSATGVPSDTLIVRLFVHHGRRGSGRADLPGPTSADVWVGVSLRRARWVLPGL